MSASTVYDVKIQYSLDDKASAALGHLGAKADEAAHHVSGIVDTLKMMGALFLGGEVLHKGKELFIDLNSELQQMKISMASVMSYNLGTSFDAAADSTERLISGWQKFSEVTTMTGMEVANFGKDMATAVFAVGGSINDLDDITKKGSVIGKLLSAGHAGGLQYAQLEFKELLMGNLRKTEQLNQQLMVPFLRQKGIDEKEWNKLDPSKRLSLFKEAISSPAWQSAIDKQAKSFEGVFSTLEHKVQMLGMEVGKELFGALGKEIEEINQWLNTHPGELEAFAKKFSSALVDGFNAVKSAIKFVVDHKGTFELLGAALLMRGMGGSMGGGAGLVGMLGPLGGMAPNFKAMAQGGDEFVAKLGGMTAALSQAAVGLTMLYAGLQFLAERLDQVHKERVEGTYTDQALIASRTKERAKLESAMASGDRVKALQIASDTVQILSGMGAFNKATGAYDESKALAGLNKANVFGSTQTAFLAYAREAVDVYAQYHTRPNFSPGFNPGGLDPTKGNAPTGKSTNVAITIHKVEVASDDPDRFVFGLTKAAEKANRNPTQAEAAVRGGF